MADPARARRLAVRIRQLVADVLERQVKDPRLGFVTVTDARVTSDLAEATVFYTVYGDDQERAATDEALHSALGMLRREVGRRLGVKTTPTLTLVSDDVPDRARHFDQLLEQARLADEERARLAAGASPAGDPDPYRVPRDRSLDDDDEHDLVGLGVDDEPDEDDLPGADLDADEDAGPRAVL